MTTIAGGAFYGCPNLHSIHLGKNASTIEHSGYTTLIGGCPKFTTFTVSKYNWDFSAVDGVLYNKSGSKLVISPVGKSATHYTFPSTVTRVGSFALAYANNLESVFIPKTVTFIGQYAFSLCYTLNVIRYEGTKAEWNAITKEADWIRYVEGQINIVCTDGTITFSRWH